MEYNPFAQPPPRPAASSPVRFLIRLLIQHFFFLINWIEWLLSSYQYAKAQPAVLAPSGGGGGTGDTFKPPPYSQQTAVQISTDELERRQRVRHCPPLYSYYALDYAAPQAIDSWLCSCGSGKCCLAFLTSVSIVCDLFSTSSSIPLLYVFSVCINTRIIFCCWPHDLSRVFVLKQAIRECGLELK